MYIICCIHERLINHLDILVVGIFVNEHKIQISIVFVKSLDFCVIRTSNVVQFLNCLLKLFNLLFF